MDDATKTEIEAAVFRRLRDHFELKPEVQNIDLTNMADFCRTCRAKWYRAAAEERGVELDYDRPRQVLCGLPEGGRDPAVLLSIGTGESDAWKSRLVASDITMIDEITGSQMAAFGYATGMPR